MNPLRPGTTSVEPTPRIENIENSASSWPELDIRPASDPPPLLEDGSVVDVTVIGCEICTAYQGRRYLKLTCQVLDGGERRIAPISGGAAVLSWYLPLPRSKKGTVPTASKFWRA